MKELKMFPQITEETEENLLNLEDEPKSPYSSTPPLNPSSSSSETPPEVPSSPNHENQVPCLLPTITTEEADRTHNHHSPPPPEDEYTTPPPRTRMRSLSGGAYRLAPSLPSSGRHRRQSGDDVLTRVSPSRRATLFDQFRPRSKSDSKGKRPTFLTSLKNSIFSGTQRKTSLDSEPSPVIESIHPEYRTRPRSGSETKGGTMSKMIDLFRSRSHSLSIDSKGKTPIAATAHALLRRHSVDPDKRRKPFSAYRSLEAHQGDAYVCHTEDDTGDTRIDYGSLDEDKIIPTFLNSRTCYDAMPLSGKVIVLSTDLLVKNAFNCLVTNDIRSAPLWESSSQTFVGMLTISDFINVLRHYYYFSQDDIKDIENQKIATWRKITKVTKPIVSIAPDESLANATKLLIQERVHRLPVYDETRNGVLFVLTRKRLLQYLYSNIVEKFGVTNLKTPVFWKKTISELKPKLGTWDNIAKVSFDTKVIKALDIFYESKVSALPMVDKDGKLVDIFAKFDVFALANKQTYHNLDMTISEALDKAEVHERVCVCTLDEPLGTVIDRILATKVHRLVAVDEKQKVIGMLSLSDILKFLVVQPLEESSIATDTIEEDPEGAVGGQDDSNVFPEPENKLQQSASLQKQDSSEISDDFVKLQLDANTPEPHSEASACEDES